MSAFCSCATVISDTSVVVNEVVMRLSVFLASQMLLKKRVNVIAFHHKLNSS